MLVEIMRKQKETELEEQEALRKERELAATVNKQADAEKYRTETQADAEKYKIEKQSDARKYSQAKEAEAVAMAIRVKAEAEAEAIRIKAEAAAILARGAAEAETMEKKAEAYKLYNEAAVTQMIIEKLPDIATAVAAPLAKTDKIVIIDNGGNGEGGKGAAKVTGYVTDIVSQLPETIEAMTGFNLMDAIKNKLGGGDGAAAAAEEPRNRAAGA